MPRIEIEPKDFDPKCGDGTPTIDVCRRCTFFFEEGAATPLYLQKRYPQSGIGSTDVEHPPYAEAAQWDEYYCDCCGDILTDEDDQCPDQAATNQ